eukprot:CAMPEP_0114132694 /NCGR_PEP_ID=MMETSP0043_2-20121206/13228_1 /TAXON_ID=464988 /ORGANISM="Hemiselmis andersenii, Strain CCMP644" /LENGTH=413 /DNA_ID=CAMNT_0001226219 /DNA_START=38 /DNA_END=1279 /DNA_ORIENTATION=-
MVASTKTAVLMALVALSCVSLSVAFHTPVHAGSLLPLKANAAFCPSSASPSRPTSSLSPTMGLRDKVKKFAAGVAAAFAVGFVPTKAFAADTVAPEPQAQEQEAGQQQQVAGPMLLPSQAAHMKRLAAGGDGPVVATVKKIAKDKRLYMVVGAAAAASGGYTVIQKKKKDDAEKARSFLSQTSGINIDASILDEKRLNRPGAKKFQYSEGNEPKFGEYREPPKKLMKEMKDKYVMKEYKKEGFKDTGDDDDYLEQLAGQVELDIFKKNRSGDTPGTNGDTVQKVGDLDVEVVGEGEGPKTAAQKELEEEMGGLDMDEMMREVMAGQGMDSAGMDPAMMAAALPALQEQLSELMKGGISKDEIQEVKKTFTDMGIDLEDMFTKIDEMEAAGLSDAVGPDGTQFFKTLRKIIDSA